MSMPHTHARSIVLIGLMGAGKSTVGRELSRTTGLSFLDTDSVIEEQTGMSIPDIFREKGERHFRLLETALLRYIAENAEKENDAHIISTGGGIVLQAENRELLRRLGFTVWLTADVPTLLARTARAQNRPLLQVENREAALEALMRQRAPLYQESAHLCLDSTGMKASEVVDAIIKQSQLYFGNSRPLTIDH